MADAAPQPLYAIEAGDVARDRDDVLAIWRGNLGQDARMQAKYDWFYAACPFGEPLLRLLRHVPSGGRVGAAAAGARRLWLDGRSTASGVLVDLAVGAEHRSLGPALMLQSALAEAGMQRFALLYGFPNPKAAPVFKRVGYAQLGVIVRHARVLRHARYVARRLPRVLASLAGAMLDLGARMRDAWRARADERVDATWADRADVRFDALWEDSPKGDVAVGVRDHAFAAWRFDASPLARARYLLVSARGDGALLAWFACQDDDGVLHVRDAWSRDGTRGVARAHVDALLSAARRAGHEAVSMEFAGRDDALAGWHAAGFVARGQRPVYGRWADDDRAATPLHLTSADEDE